MNYNRDFSHLDIAHLSTATNATIYLSSDPKAQDEGLAIHEQSDIKQNVNVQLAFWKDAKNKYLTLVKPIDSQHIEHLVLVVTSLFLSLTFLFGVNFEKKDIDYKTPCLIDMVKKWKLKNERPDLYRSLLEIDDFFSTNIRHTDFNKINKEVISLSKQTVKEFLETTRKVWIWFINKYCEKHNNVVVPSELLDEFISIDD